MSSLITSLSSVTSETPTSSDFYARLKSILSPMPTSDNLPIESTHPSFSEWKRKVKCASELDFCMQKEVGDQQYGASLSREVNRARDSLRISKHVDSIGFHDPMADLFTSNHSMSRKSSSYDSSRPAIHDSLSTCSRQMFTAQLPSAKYSRRSVHSSFVSSTLEVEKDQPDCTTTATKTPHSSAGLCNESDSLTTSNGGKLHTKKSTSGHRKNIWKNQTYADLICKAILSSPSKRLTLSQIYDWLIDNIEYFKAKKDGKSSVGWKNSIRHNLSLHSRFVRIQGHESGKSSWWTVDLTAKSTRRSKRKVFLSDTSKLIHGFSTTATAAFGSQIPTLFRYQTPYSGCSVNGQSSSTHGSFYQPNKDGWLDDNCNLNKADFSSKSTDDKCSLSSCYFPYNDPYSTYYSSSFLPSTLAPVADTTNYITSRSNGINYSYYSRAPNNDKSFSNGRYFPSSSLNQYDSLFYFKNSAGLQLADPSSTNLSVLGAVGDTVRSEGTADDGKTLPSLFSSLYNEFDNFKGIRQGNLDYIYTPGYEYHISPSKYSHHSMQQTVLSEEIEFMANYKKLPLSGFMEDVKLNLTEQNMSIT